MRRKSSYLIYLWVAVFVVVQLVPGKLAVHAEGNCLNPETPGCMFGLPTYQYQLLLGEMAAHPEPDVRQLPVDMNEIGENSASRVIGGSQPVYDAPDGNQVGVLNA